MVAYTLLIEGRHLRIELVEQLNTGALGLLSAWMLTSLKVMTGGMKRSMKKMVNIK